MELVYLFNQADKAVNKWTVKINAANTGEMDKKTGANIIALA